MAFFLLPDFTAQGRVTSIFVLKVYGILCCIAGLHRARAHHIQDLGHRTKVAKLWKDHLCIYTHTDQGNTGWLRQNRRARYAINLTHVVNLKFISQRRPKSGKCFCISTEPSKIMFREIHSARLSQVSHVEMFGAAVSGLQNSLYTKSE